MRHTPSWVISGQLFRWVSTTALIWDVVCKTKREGVRERESCSYRENVKITKLNVAGISFKAGDRQPTASTCVCSSPLLEDSSRGHTTELCMHDINNKYVDTWKVSILVVKHFRLHLFRTVHLMTDFMIFSIGLSTYYTTTTHTVSQTVQQSGEESIVCLRKNC